MPHGGNVNIMTVMGDARMDGLSDAGSTPARSTYDAESELDEFGFCAFIFTRKMSCCTASFLSLDNIFCLSRENL